ncbi:MAG: DinB family protein [Gemmatimonadetes bacterium]|nr:DinB family protein [Gemmatimonadota bacterium]
MLSKSIRIAFVAAFLATLPGTVSAQMQTWKDVQVADVQTMKDKFVGLAEAFTEAQYDYRPMEGVRSVKEVLALAVVEAHIFPTAWGVTAPAGTGTGFGPENQRVGALNRAQLIRELNSAFDHLIGAVRNMDEAKRNEPSTYFGRQMPVHANIATGMADMHEHLGQLIAYARANRVVPPWSR